MKNWILIAVPLILLIEVNCMGQQSQEPPAGLMAGQAQNTSRAQEPGLLFYLSGENGFRADFAAGGQDTPNFLKDVRIIPDGAFGKAFEAGDSQLMSYWAPGNVFSQRGTLSFFWRSRYPVGPTPFPVFRIAFADHTSWDMAWLRIDYNGSGFDAFVTDVGLARTRVSHYMDTFPAPGDWTHIAFSWDETHGVRLYINGKLAEQKSVVGKVFDTGLDQLGPHSRIISPYQVQSLYNFMRGGDLDEVRIYDRMLTDRQVDGLSRGEIQEKYPVMQRDLKDRRWRDAWWDRHGWNLPNKPPPLLSSGNMVIRKIGIHEAYDVKRLMWKANDGIRETTWPGVYNMSRLPGRYDYFVYPDWDCYSMSGQTIRFYLPEEPWNHVEIWGKAWGQLTYEREDAYDQTFGVRKKEQIKSFHRLESPVQGGKIRFDNALIEEPIGELGVYYVYEGSAPQGSLSESFLLDHYSKGSQNKTVKAVSAFIDGRYPADERTKMIGLKQGQTLEIKQKELADNEGALPFIHMILPYSSHSDYGLDGMVIEVPALPVKPTHDGLFPLNIRIKDPLWPMRDMVDFSFSVKPGMAHTLWIDTRDRILPEGKALYITLAGAGSGLSSEVLKGSQIRLVYKPGEEARKEHETDRFTQVRDLFGFSVEERPSTSRLNLYNRFVADQTDLMRVNPDHRLGQVYAYAQSRNIRDRPAYKIPECPAGIPGWAFLQVEYLRQIETITSYYIDHRQVSNGEFGGGLSDDDDFTNLMAGAALMGIEPEKTEQSLKLFLEAFYDEDRDPYNAALRQRSLPLFTNGLATISTDFLHAYEEGIEAVGQLMLLDYGNPLYMSRGMEIAKRVLEDITRIAPDGHRHFRSRFFGGTEISEEDPWQWSGHYSYNLLHTPYLIAGYNGNPMLQKMIIELADALLEHRDEKGNFYTEMHFRTGETRGRPGLRNAWQVFLAAYEFTGDPKYLPVVLENKLVSGKFNAKDLEKRYTENIKHLGVLEYPNTVGSIWIDRVSANTNSIQADRLGGVALARIRQIYPQNYVSWNIKKPADYKSLAVFVSDPGKSGMKIIAFNLEGKTIHAGMRMWNIDPGKWRVISGIDTDNDQQMDIERSDTLVYLEKGTELELSFASRKSTILTLELVEPAEKAYAERPDLGISSSGVRIDENRVIVRVYSQGAVASPETTLELWDANGEHVGTTAVPAMDAPINLNPNWIDIALMIPPDTDLSHGTIRIDPQMKMDQITRNNTVLTW